MSFRYLVLHYEYGTISYLYTALRNLSMRCGHKMEVASLTAPRPSRIQVVVVVDGFGGGSEELEVIALTS